MNTSTPIRLVLIAPEPEGEAQPARPHGVELARILSTDHALAQSLGHPLPTSPIESVPFLQETLRWCAERKAVSFAIVLENGAAVGQFSISRIDGEHQSARFGYFLASAHWGTGVMTQAFALALDEARSRGLRRVCGFVPTDSSASHRLWSRHGAEAKKSEDGTLYTLTL